MSTLIVIAKAPVAGRVKTRLTPDFTAEEAADLARAALTDTLDAALAADFEQRLLVLDGDPALVARSAELTVIPQVGGGLDRRLAAAFQEAVVVGSGPVLLIGMDTPQVTGPLLEACLPSRYEDAVLGPAVDGGFWALGFSRPGDLPLEQLIFDVPMSTDSTGAAQLDRLTGFGLRVRVLPTLRDVDTVDDVSSVAAAAPASRFARAVASYTSVPVSV